MIEYHCKGSVKLYFTVTLLLCVGSILFLIALPWIRAAAYHEGDPSGEVLWLSFPVILFLGGFAWWAAGGLMDTLSTYRMDDQGITRRRWNGREQHMDWQAVDHTASSRRGKMVLIDHSGERLIVPPPSYHFHSELGHDLRHQADRHLAHKHAAPLQPTSVGHTFPFGAPLVDICLFFLAACLIGGAVLFAQSPPSTPQPTGLAAGMPLVWGIGGTLLILCALHLRTRAYILTDTSLTYRTLFLKREIPFAEVQAILTRELSAKSRTIEQTVLARSKTRIVLTESIPGYEEMVRTIRSHLGPHVAENSSHAIVHDMRRDRRDNGILGFIIGCFFALILGGASQEFQGQAQYKLAQEHALDTRGKQITGQITATHPYSGKNLPAEIYYAFDAGGTRYPGVAVVSRDDYEEARVGQTVSVVYLPEDPRISRIPQSNERDSRQDQLGATNFMLIFAFALPVLMPLMTATQTAKYRPQPPTIPQKE